MNTPHERLTTAIRIDISPLQLREEIVEFHVLRRGTSLQTPRNTGNRRSLHPNSWSFVLLDSCQPPIAAMPVRLGPAYPRGSRSRVFTVLRQRLSLPKPENAARCAYCRKSDPPLATSRRFPGSRKLCPANPKLSPFR